MMRERTATLAEHLEQFPHLFRPCFRRREQAEWAAVYLQGLHETTGRKTIENLARGVTLPPGLHVDDVAQALQHFINQSPWDEKKLQRHYLAFLRERQELSGIFVLDECAFVKQGRHSVGVHRQYSAVVGHKTNCQIAVALHHLSREGFHPLALRLYLPRRWLEDRQRLDTAGVPDFARRVASKSLLALELLDEARAAGIPANEVVPGPTWGRSDELRELLQQRGWSWRTEVPPDLVETLTRGQDRLLNELGLGHFEGRSWRGFHHHACLVLLACGLLVGSQDEKVCPD